MARRCMITGKKPQSGNNVSHAQNKTRRRFLPNIQVTNLYSEMLQQKLAIKTTAAGLRTIDHKGGLDAYLLNTAASKIQPELKKYRTKLLKLQQKTAAAK